MQPSFLGVVYVWQPLIDQVIGGAEGNINMLFFSGIRVTFSAAIIDNTVECFRVDHIFLCLTS